MTPAKCIVLLPAAGSGARCGELKQFSPLAGKTVLWHAAQVFLQCARVSEARVLVAPAQLDEARAVFNDAPLIPPQQPAALKVLPLGGDARAQTVRNGLEGIPPDHWVAVHDAARPCLSAGACERLLGFMDTAENEPAAADGAALALPASEALKTARGGRLTGAVSRDDVWMMQTPQLFRAGQLRAALAAHPTAADEAEAILQSGGSVQVIHGERANIKITYADDLSLAARLLSPSSPL